LIVCLAEISSCASELAMQRVRLAANAALFKS
jgi:hypothetical protein